MRSSEPLSSGGARARHGVDDGRYGGAHDGKHVVIGKEVVTVLGANLPGAGEKYKLVLYKINTNTV